MVLMSLFMFVPPTAAQSPDGLVSGVVRDENGEPLVGAVVNVPGTSRGVSTNVDGEYTIKAKKGESLEFSYVGYEKQRVKIQKSPMTLNVAMVPDSRMQMDEVVVIGYGKVKKTDLTGSVSTVKMADIRENPVLSVDQALQGRVPGADIMSASGDPGSTTQIRIRGTRSISASNEPLIVVDGVMDAVHDLKDLNMADIASVSVLKDASSTAIYGSRGSNGVIIVTTKQGAGSGSKPNVTFKADVGFSQLPRGLDTMNAAEFAQYRNDYAFHTTNDGYGSITTGTPQKNYPYPDPKSYGEGTDWVKEITRTAPVQTYALSISGRSKKASYYASLSYNDTRGIIQDSGIKRITGRLNLDYKFTDWLKVGYKGTYAHFDQDCNKAEIGGTAWYQAALYLNPMLQPNADYNPLWNGGQKFNTPRATIDLNTHIMPRYSMTHTVSFDFTLGKHWLVRSQESYYQYQRDTYRYYPSTLPRKTEDEGGQAYRASYNQHRLSTENTATYNVDINKAHHIDAMVGFTAYKEKSNTFTLEGKGYMDDAVMWNNMNAVVDKETYSASTSMSNKTKMSFLGRFNYNFKQRYYLTLTGRYDGASNFASNNKWAFFPSGALKWNVANEPFMKNVQWIDEFSLRASAGRTGNDAISAYRSMSAMGSSTSGYLFGGSQPVAYYRSRLASPNLSWEKTDLYNIATDLSFLDGRIAVTAEGYISKTTDLLLTVQTPAHTGYTSRFENIGKTSNKGVELTIDTRNITKRNFSWTTTFTIAHNEQNVDDIGSEDFVVAMQSSGTNKYMMNGYVKGYPLNALWGFHYGGVWHNIEEFQRNEVTKAYVSENKILSTAYANNLGMPRFLDMNHDGALSQDDLVYLGNADPVLYGGLQNSFRIGNFNISMYWNYSIGGKIYNYPEYWMAGSVFTNQYRYMLNGWHPVR
ncbi:MAG: TonB-dependent receptor, partial [Muribaculaceae bacterium]|nr:TonB-dependent receptor [Muribaculaceae bacterium]